MSNLINSVIRFLKHPVVVFVLVLAFSAFYCYYAFYANTFSPGVFSIAWIVCVAVCLIASGMNLAVYIAGRVTGRE